MPINGFQSLSKDVAASIAAKNLPLQPSELHSIEPVKGYVKTRQQTSKKIGIDSNGSILTKKSRK
jgi:hypothetical protein